MAQKKFVVEDGLEARDDSLFSSNVTFSGEVITVGSNVHAQTVGGTLQPLYIEGSVVPTANATYNLGSTTNRFQRIFANSISVANTVEITNTANLYSGAISGGNITFASPAGANPPVTVFTVGNTTTQPVVYSSNTYTKDYLQVGPLNGTNPYLTVNSSIMFVGANTSIQGNRQAFANNKVIYERLQPVTTPYSYLAISTNSGSPTVIDTLEIGGTEQDDYATKVIKYIIHVRDARIGDGITNKKAQASEIMVVFHQVQTDIMFTEYGVTAVDTPFITYGIVTSGSGATAQVRLTAYADTTDQVYLTMLKTQLK